MEGRLVLMVGLGSALGGVARYLIREIIPSLRFPIGTFLVNAVGCFLMAFLLYRGVSEGWWGKQMNAFLGIGFFGGFTTMSAFALETVAETPTWAALYVTLTIGSCLGGAVLGRYLGLLAAG